MSYSRKKNTTKIDGYNATILGIPIFSSPRDVVLKTITGWVEGKTPKSGVSLVFTPNSEMLVEAKKDKDFENVLKQADMNIPDGVGLVIASRILDQNISASQPSRLVNLAGTDLGKDLFMMAVQRGWRVYLLGARERIAQKAGEALEITARESGKEVNPRFAWKAGRPEDVDAVKEINEFKPDLLFVALGHKKQESWLLAHKDILSAKVGFGIGGAFDFWSGTIKRAPEWIRKLGFEWLYRLIQEPWRWRRQLRLFEFGWLVFKARLGL